jgi:hypothetical protein
MQIDLNPQCGNQPGLVLDRDPCVSLYAFREPGYLACELDDWRDIPCVLGYVHMRWKTVPSCNCVFIVRVLTVYSWYSLLKP